MRIRPFLAAAALLILPAALWPSEAHASAPSLSVQGDTVSGHSITLTYSSDDPQICADGSTIVFYWDWNGSSGTTLGNGTVDTASCTATWTGLAPSDPGSGDHTLAADLEPAIAGVDSTATTSYAIKAASLQVEPTHGQPLAQFSVKYTYPGSACPAGQVDLTWQQGGSPADLGQQSLNGCTAQWMAAPPSDAAVGAATLQAVALASDGTPDGGTKVETTYTVDAPMQSTMPSATPASTDGGGATSQSPAAKTSIPLTTGTSAATPAPIDSFAAVATTATGLGAADIPALPASQPVAAGGLGSALTVWPLLLIFNAVSVTWIMRSIQWRRRFKSRTRGE